MSHQSNIHGIIIVIAFTRKGFNKDMNKYDHDVRSIKFTIYLLKEL